MIAIDFTTISTVENSAAYAWFINREFELDIAPHVLEQLETFRDFATLPQAAPFFARARIEPALSAQIEEVIDAVDFAHPLLLRKLRPVPGAPAAVTELASTHHLVYVTRRPYTNESAMRAWLEQHDFPVASLYFCQSDAEKWLRASYGAGEEEIILIDNQASGIAAYRQFCGRLPEEARRFQKRSVLLAFASQQVRSTLPFPTYPLSSWEDVRTLTTASI